MNRRSFVQGATALFASLLAGPEQIEGPASEYAIGVDHGLGNDRAAFALFRGERVLTHQKYRPTAFTDFIEGLPHRKREAPGVASARFLDFIHGRGVFASPSGDPDAPVRMGELAIEELT